MPFLNAELRSRYPTHDAYMERINPVVERNVEAGYLLPVDAEDFLERAKAAAFRWEELISP